MKPFRELFAVISICLVFLFPGCAGINVNVADTPQVIVNTDRDISQTDIERVKKEAENAVDTICATLGVEKRTIKINIIENGMCHMKGDIIYLPRWHVENKKASIVPLVLNSLGRKIDNSFFRIGLGGYFQDKFGKDHAFPNFTEAPLNVLVRNYRNRLFAIHELVGNSDIWRRVGTLERQVGFIQAASFIKYLAETYGEKRLVALYNSSTLNYEKIYGKDIKELGIKWEKSVLEDNSFQYPAGIVTGPKAAFLISAPEGWLLDNRSGLPQGLHCVLYPKGRTWANSSFGMYVKIASTQFTKKEEFIEFAIDANRKKDTDFSHKILKQGKTSEGYGFTIIEYNLPRFSQYEFVGYIQVPDAVAYIVFVTHDTKSRIEHSGAFNETLASFLYRPDYINKTEP